MKSVQRIHRLNRSLHPYTDTRRTQLAPVPAGHYRIGEGVHIQQEGDTYVALCDYPLRVTRLTPAVARLLSLCETPHTSAELSTLLKLSPTRVEALCEQLRWKALLDAGSPLPPATLPGVSIVIPAYNRATELERCIRSLFALNYPSHLLEIVVVDDASTNETQTMLDRIQLDTQGIELRVIRHERQQGVAIARNTGTGAARHARIAYIDSDCVASSDWLQELVSYLQEPDVAIVGGEIRALDCTSLAGRYEDVRSSLYMGPRVQQVRREGPLTYLPTANLLLRKSAWEQLHGFEPLTQGEDVDFCRRLLATGARILYVPHGTVYHDYRTQLHPFLAIRAAYATAEATLLQRHPYERRILVLPPEQASFSSLVLGTLVALFRVRTSRFARLIVLASLLITLVHLFRGTYSRRQKIQQVTHVPIRKVFLATLRGHLAYTYHLCRHLTRYYTLPLLALSICIPLLWPLTIALCCIVILVDYIRLKPDMRLDQYTLYALLDDCAYEWGVVKGCIREKTWKPLWPIIKTHV